MPNYSNCREENEHHFRLVFQVLRENKIYLKLRKSSFYIEDWNHWRMANTQEYFRNHIFYGTSWILQEVYNRVL
jgi:hypothetical protein